MENDMKALEIPATAMMSIEGESITYTWRKDEYGEL